jgi:hypothetical protein
MLLRSWNRRGYRSTTLSATLKNQWLKGMVAVDKNNTHTYEMDRGAQRLGRGLAAFFVGLCALMTPVHLLGSHLFGLIPKPMDGGSLVFADSFLIALATFLYWTSFQKAVLDDQKIVVDWPFWIRELKRSEIAGWRTRQFSRYPGLSYVIVPADRKKRDLRLPANLQVDGYFHDWLKTLPDLTGR